MIKVHGDSIEDLKEKPVLSSLINKKIFQRYIILCNKNKVGTVKLILDKNFKEVYINDY